VPRQCRQLPEQSLPMLWYEAAPETRSSTRSARNSAGRKQTRWISFIFPQLRALRRSDTAKRFGPDNAAQARAYLQPLQAIWRIVR
jgi:uncharacterized protein (DUF1810 family)